MTYLVNFYDKLCYYKQLFHEQPHLALVYLLSHYSAYFRQIARAHDLEIYEDLIRDCLAKGLENEWATERAQAIRALIDRK